MENKIKLLAVCGPTASGKTALSIALAKALGGEIVSCDSMQIYRGMEIGTAKPTPAEMDGVPHHLLGFLEPSAAFSAADYTQLAAEAVRGIVSRGHIPLLVGGTGLYARALLRGMSFPEESCDEAVRAALYDAYAADGIEPLYERLRTLDPEAAAQIHPNNTKRVIRALEYCTTTGGLFSEQAKASQTAASPYDYRMLCLSCRDREALYARINRRVDQMLEDGLLEEARRYFEQCGTSAGTSAQAIGYKELRPYFEGAQHACRGGGKHQKRRRAVMRNGSSHGLGARKIRRGFIRMITRMRPRCMRRPWRSRRSILPAVPVKGRVRDE
ncbi:MAG: tRNA (adenosine(37)-N6)-dimethylallyltransferase MiaA [Acutalibacteraceae bacterium]